MKGSTTVLPQGYVQFDHIDLQKDKKTALALNIAATVFFIGALVLGHFAFVPVTENFDIDSFGYGMYFLRLGALLVGYFAYIVLHELTHAAAMKLYKATKLRFGFTGLYAYAGSEVDYFGKVPYRVIALAPLVVWTLLLTVPLILLPKDWFWVFYFIQCGNIAGCIGDIYVTVRLLPMPKDILVRDTGVEMFVFSRR
ncbi:MAG: DUF3267 domain-containing protein, partial [Ruminococcus sp.]|nr:DUF3267 domain-containing protein [Ruminococcus sp.]